MKQLPHNTSTRQRPNEPAGRGAGGRPASGLVDEHRLAVGELRAADKRAPTGSLETVAAQQNPSLVRCAGPGAPWPPSTHRERPSAAAPDTRSPGCSGAATELEQPADPDTGLVPPPATSSSRCPTCPDNGADARQAYAGDQAGHPHRRRRAAPSVYSPDQHQAGQHPAGKPDASTDPLCSADTTVELEHPPPTTPAGLSALPSPR